MSATYKRASSGKPVDYRNLEVHVAQTLDRFTTDSWRRAYEPPVAVIVDPKRRKAEWQRASSAQRTVGESERELVRRGFLRQKRWGRRVRYQLTPAGEALAEGWWRLLMPPEDDEPLNVLANIEGACAVQRHGFPDRPTPGDEHAAADGSVWKFALHRAGWWGQIDWEPSGQAKALIEAVRMAREMELGAQIDLAEAEFRDREDPEQVEP